MRGGEEKGWRREYAERVGVWSEAGGNRGVRGGGVMQSTIRPSPKNLSSVSCASFSHCRRFNSEDMLRFVARDIWQLVFPRNFLCQTKTLVTFLAWNSLTREVLLFLLIAFFILFFFIFASKFRIMRKGARRDRFFALENIFKM